jgi:hypothetical protein
VKARDAPDVTPLLLAFFGNAMGKLLAWETPFLLHLFPKVWISMGAHLGELSVSCRG